ncbi:MAG TPA: hypothetical protein DCZ94_02150 [Lentisphaeria bacterium]|nr:MAG: hypothetical protein A2X48_19940 [Lentisphaerae bacterium GWF2_49_21]HBC85736.1 hypothetical protein [Lentisphaeria bacterium]
MKTNMTHRERVRVALEHRETDRIPIAMVCSGLNAPVRKAFEEYLRKNRGIGADEYFEPLIDIRNVEPAYIGPALPAGTDIWGVRKRSVSYGEGAYDEIEHYPLGKAKNIGDVVAYKWPSPDMFDYGALHGRIRELRKKGDFCLMAHNGNPFESSWYLRGFEQALMDMVLAPEIMQAILEKVTTFYISYFKRILEAADGEIDLVFTADDIGSQESLLFSLEMWEEHIKPWHSKLNRAIHEYGAKVIYHSDGAVTEAVPGLIDMGIDVLQALQFDARDMDPEFLKNTYGDRLCFEGGVSVQSTLPFGTPEKVRTEVLERIRILGKNGGYILGPSHLIQAGTPPENIAAMFDTAAGNKLLMSS